MKKVPQRMCVCCRTMFPQKELLRIVKNSENEIFIDEKGKSSGRGAYICKNKQCIEKARKQKVFERVFATKLPDNLYNELEGKTINE